MPSGGQGPGWEPLTRLEPDPSGGLFRQSSQELEHLAKHRGDRSCPHAGSYSVPRLVLVRWLAAGRDRPLEEIRQAATVRIVEHKLTYAPMPATNTQGNDPAARPRIQASILAEFPAYYHGSPFDIDCPSTTHQPTRSRIRRWLLRNRSGGTTPAAEGRSSYLRIHLGNVKGFRHVESRYLAPRKAWRRGYQNRRGVKPDSKWRGVPCNW